MAGNDKLSIKVSRAIETYIKIKHLQKRIEDLQDELNFWISQLNEEEFNRYAEITSLADKLGVNSIGELRKKLQDYHKLKEMLS